MITEFGRKRWGPQNFTGAHPPETRLQGGKYTILEFYGNGPFSISYLSRQNLLGKKVIINEFFLLNHCTHTKDNKVVNDTLSAGIYLNFRAKWFEEAMLLSKCSRNEHFVTVLDAFEENDTAYYVTDYIGEDDLKTFTLDRAEKHLPESLAVQFITQISDGLTFLHDNNIFHLNLSPIKVLIDKGNRAIIFSVGIARHHIPQEIIPDITMLTKAGYSAPELYSRAREDGRLTDIYSLGAILYFLLTGKDPIPAPERVNKPMAEPKTLNPSVSAGTNAAIMKAMAMDPEVRYQSLSAFRNDLTKNPQGSNQRITRKVLYASALVLFAIGLLSAGVFWFVNRPRDNREEQAFVEKKRVKRQDQLTQLTVEKDLTREVTMLRDPESKDSAVVGKNYALLIGIESYKDSRFHKLIQPVHDVNALYDVLVTNYTFEKNNVLILTDPVKKDIFKALNFYRDSLNPNDNLFVFYAGHGCYDKKADMGYIIPVDADFKNDADWISFQSIREKFNIIAAKHILLIADACYAGSVFRGEESASEDGFDKMILEQINKRSRKAFTSAYLNPVPDRSEFLRHLISNLENNSERLYLSEDLYINTRTSLLRSTTKTDPVRYGVMKDCGDEGGDFIFIRRKK